MKTHTSSTVTPSTPRAGRAIGAMFFSVFGGAWLALWAYSEFAESIAVILGVLAATLGLLWRSYVIYKFNSPALKREKDSPENKRKERLFNLVNVGQWVAIFAVYGLLSMSGHETLILPAIILIVGAHFIPLARLFNYPPHYITGAAMMLLAVSFPLVASEGPTSGIGALGAGLILWLSAVWAVSPYSQVQGTDHDA